MKFAKNTQLVEEVMDFIRKHKLFNNNFHVNNLEVINDINEAQGIVERLYNLDLVSQENDLYDFLMTTTIT